MYLSPVIFLVWIYSDDSVNTTILSTIPTPVCSWQLYTMLFLILMLLYCISLINAYKLYVFIFQAGDVPPLSLSCVFRRSSRIEPDLPPQKSELLNPKPVVTRALHWAWCIITERLTEHSNSDSALHANCVGGGGISSSIMSFVCTNSSTSVAHAFDITMWFYTHGDAFTVAFICRFIVLCPIVLHWDALSFHIPFFINSCLICVNVYMLKKKKINPTPPSLLWLYQKINKVNKMLNTNILLFCHL